MKRMTEKQSKLTRFAWFDGLLVLVAGCAVFAAVVGANALREEAVALAPAVESYDGSFPLGVELLFRAPFPC